MGHNFQIGTASGMDTGRDLDFVRRFQVVVRENKATGLVFGSACGVVGRPWPRSREVWAPWLGLGLALRAGQPPEPWSLGQLGRRVDKQPMVPLYIHIGNKVK
jgi:hypothetical protein